MDWIERRDAAYDERRTLFNAKLDRLAAIKAEYDPDNVFAGNHNIRPKVPA